MAYDFYCRKYHTKAGKWLSDMFSRRQWLQAGPRLSGQVNSHEWCFWNMLNWRKKQLISLPFCEFWDVQRSFPPLQDMRQQSWLYWPPCLGHCSHPAGVFYMLLATCNLEVNGVKLKSCFMQEKDICLTPWLSSMCRVSRLIPPWFFRGLLHRRCPARLSMGRARCLYSLAERHFQIQMTRRKWSRARSRHLRSVRFDRNLPQLLTTRQVNNTDAEGRLTLADALLYCQQQGVTEVRLR